MSHHPALMGRTRNSRGARGRSRSSGAAASGDTFLAPYDLDVVPWASWANAGGFTPVRVQASILLGMGATGQSHVDTANDGDWQEWSVCLAAGTYTITVIAFTLNTQGSIDYTLDGAAVGTKDWYSADFAFNVVAQFTGIAATAGVHTFRGTVNGKNPGSTDYTMPTQWFTFTRTGA